MLSVVSEAASEGMLFSAICAQSRFHTAKGHSGHGPNTCWLDSVANDDPKRTFS
jgi:hypothetical protein